VSGGASSTAAAILERLLLILPLASRGEGARIEALAESLGVEPRRILRDLKELEGRCYYLPAGLGDQIQITLTREVLGVWTTGEFQRPVRLTPREALALELALRVMARKAPPGDRPALEDLRERLVRALRTPTSEEAANPEVALGGAEAVGDPLRVRVEDALRNERELRLRYAAPGRDPSARRVGPLLLVHAEGSWYLVARDLEREGYRAFRLDRILEAEETGAPFARAPGDGEAAEGFLRDGRVHDGGGPDAPESFEAVVDYTPRIARWIREAGWDGLEEAEDGGVRVRHRVTDPRWLVRHVLSYGPDARLLEPAWARERVVAALLRTAGQGVARRRDRA
jgi:proteasome accessory factor C